jgi:hypothetical protein
MTENVWNESGEKTMKLCVLNCQTFRLSLQSASGSKAKTIAPVQLSC